MGRLRLPGGPSRPIGSPAWEGFPRTLSKGPGRLSNTAAVRPHDASAVPPLPILPLGISAAFLPIEPG